MPEAIAWERRVAGQLIIRGDSADAAFIDAVQRTLGGGLPTVPNTVSVTSEGVAYWLGPDEWLFVTAMDLEATLARALREALRGLHAAVTPVGGGAFVWLLRGAAVREVLAKECPFDLNASGFAAGACAQTRLAKAAVLLRPFGGDAMELIVRRSFAGYLERWLEDAAGEYGLRAVAPAT